MQVGEEIREGSVGLRRKGLRGVPVGFRGL